MDDDTDELVPPSAARVAARAITLCVVSCRGFIDQDAAQAGDFWTRVRDWHGSLDIDDELEPRERSLLETPLGQLSQQQRAEASWLCEGMVVLAWALRCRTLPAHDETIVAAEVADTLGFLEPASKTVLHDPRLRPSEELRAYGDVIFAVDWRLREFGLRPGPMDFRRFAETAWFGPLSLEGVRLLEDDLAIDDAPIAKADSEAVQSCMSVAIERNRAANWLLGEGDTYSAVHTST